jgi:hypothetical protein
MPRGRCRPAKRDYTRSHDNLNPTLFSVASDYELCTQVLDDGVSCVYEKRTRAVVPRLEIRIALKKERAGTTGACAEVRGKSQSASRREHCPTAVGKV